MSLANGEPTLKDVARLASVSAKTASRVLNDHPSVSDATRAAVVQAMQTLDYQPDEAARSLRAGTDRLVGVVVDSIGDVFFAQLVATIEAVLGDAGYRVLIASSNRDARAERDTVQNLVQRRCAGVIVSPTGRDSLVGVRLRGIPVVFVDRVGDLLGAQSVVADDFGLARLATTHLIEHGHRRIALLSDQPVVETTQRRHEGFRAAMAEADLPVDDQLVRSDCPGASEVMRVVASLLTLDNPPTALISTNTRLSLGVVPALHQHGRTDIAFVAFGDFALAESLSPGVTVIDHSPEAVGSAAAQTLLDRLRSATPDALKPITIVPARLIERGSGELSPRTAPSDRRTPPIKEEA
ncbi:LacI family DNA-binding transcriptional regulator [Pengzhenrongella sicca]|uniref:LacI family DNA-binding transcriptional regulator n=1 Tax=Pengzhenrongella sicca TaxID=2819238 RepID=A0A8A4ZG89_9MICO|nr:LacI family DNA-binding transcriptional regulator [Pengzhenrongella sicca]QTE31050.1 LacI family DNA-binding transcriptional regulator [Pengzhenrongella sicca]